jgi:amino acid adenylation domain-containing protein/FkbH-like protein/non-ribosomal peptide synthase protein (TIGR01720 family)
MHRRTIAISSNFTAEPVRESLAFWMDALGFSVDLAFAPFDQLFQQLLDPSSLLSRNESGVNVLLLKLDDWARHSSSLDAKVAELVAALRASAARSTSHHLLVLCPAAPAALADPAAATLLASAEAALASALEDVANLRIVSSDEVLSPYPLADYYDAAGETLGGIPYSVELFAALGTIVARHVRAVLAAPYKVVVLDCDNTLWKGIVGEVGAAGVEIGAEHRALQEFMVRQHDAGMLICLVSKNNAPDVDEVFRTRDMPLTMEHVVSARVNWNPKSENLKSLAAELGLGLDSFIFVDDSAFEIGEVRSSCPEVLSLQLPVDARGIEQFMAHGWAFDRLRITAEDRRRALSYKDNVRRDNAAKQADSLEDFLRDLQLEVEISTPSASELARAAQMTQRTNQFNATTIRRTESELARAFAEGSLECRIVRVRDRFGDYGIVGLVLYAVTADALRVDTMLLSCRALGRRVEHRMLAELGQIAEGRGRTSIELPFVRTARNAPSFEFLNGLSASLDTVPEQHLFVVSSQDALSAPSRAVMRLDAAISRSENDAPAAVPSTAVAASALLTQVFMALGTPDSILEAIGNAKRTSSVHVARSTAFVAPAGENERVLADAWARVLGLDDVGTEDNFFELGGDSISMIQVIGRARRAGLSISPEELFKHPTVAELARIARPLDAAPTPPAAAREPVSLEAGVLAQLGVSEGDVEDVYPLSALQQGLLFHSLSAAGASEYLVQMRVTLRGVVRIEELRRAWEEVVRRHAVLRTAFLWELVPAPVQVVLREVSIPFAADDWRGAVPSDHPEKFEHLLAADRARGFELHRAPLSRLTIVQTEDEVSEVVWSYHHLILDGWSAHTVLREVHELYDSAIAGTEIAFEAPHPYRDYVTVLEQGDDETEAFWRRRLAGLQSPTPLGIPLRLSAPQLGEHAEEELVLTAEATAALQAFAREHRLTMNTVLQGAWAMLLSNYSGQHDVLFGATVTTRPITFDGSERMVGLFLNTVPVRARVAPQASVSEWLQRLQRSLAELRAHETTSLASIQRWSDVPRGTPLFDSVLVVENFPGTESLAGASSGVTFESPRILERTHYPVMLIVLPGERLVVRCMYDATRFDADAITWVLGDLEAVLRRFVAEPLGMLREVDAISHSPTVSAISEQERELVLREWNATARSYPRDVVLHELIGAQASRTPDAVALDFCGETLTHGELDARATTLARALAARGVRPGVMVGVCMERSIELVVALVAVLKAGAAYVPMDPEYPADRLAFMLADARCPVLLTQERVAASALAGLAEQGGAQSVAILCVDRDWDRIASEGAGVRELPKAAPSDLAYMIYTSGSTGQPKGAMNRHSGIVNRLLWMQDSFALTPGDVVLQKTPMSFDVSVWEFFWPLLAGARLVLAEPGGHRDAAYVAGVIRETGVTVMHFVPSMLRAFLDSGAATLPTTLRDVMCSGEALPYELQERFFAQFPATRLHNLYGPTEAAVDVTVWSCVRGDARKIVPIGRPIANTQVYVLDAAMEPAPVGESGELYLGGVQVGAGYHRRPELTDEKFVRDIFSDDQSARLYRTGDSARWLSDGTIEYLGRLDFQVKLRGFRIELGEIEAALNASDAVRDSAVVLRTDPGTEPRLVAYYVAEPGTPTSATELRAHLAETLPAHMLPAAFVAVAEMPLSPSGKLDRKAFPAPELDEAAQSRNYVAPRSDAETILADIWARVLRVQRVGVEDNFYELGGDSILSIQIAARAREAGLPVTVAAITKHATIADLVTTLDGAAAARRDREPSTGDAPLTPIQRWFFELDPVERNHWNQAFLFRTEYELDEIALHVAVDALIEQHDALRSRFAPAQGTWTQRVAATGDETPMWIEDLSGVSDEALASAIGAVTDRAAKSLDIARGPVVRAVYIRLGGTRGGRLLLAAHHLVVDGVSWRILREDLEAAYESQLAGTPGPRPSKTSSYQHWAQELSAQAESGWFDDERAFWRDVSAEPVIALPVDGDGADENVVGEARTIVATLDERETSELLQKVPAAYATQINDVLAVALAEALAPWTGDGALLVDLEGHGREEIEAELDLTRTVGWFTSIFPVRLDVGATADVGQRLKAVKEQLRAMPRRGIGYGALRYLVNDPQLATQPKAEVLLNYLGQLDQLVADSALFRFAAEDAGPWFAARSRRPYLLEIVAAVRHGRIEFRWTFGHRHHDDATIQRLADAMLGALRAIIAHCTAPGAGGRSPSDYPLVSLTQEQVDRIVGDGKMVEDIAPLAPMQALFLATSGGSGVDVGFEQWSYAIEGDVDSDALARAWQHVASRQQILRTAFEARGLAEPVQVIRRRVELPFVEHDWRGLDAATRAVRMEELLAADRLRGFVVSEAPLMRIALVRTRDDAWTMVWSNHHLLLDRWSWPIVLHEVGVAYRAFRIGAVPELPTATPWRRYLSWLHDRDAAATETFWRGELAGAEGASLAALAGAGDVGGEQRLELSTSETDALRSFAREQRVTVNALISAAWGLWLGGAAGRGDVVFGVATSGRPDAVAGIDRLVGMCINNVPSRVRFGDDETLSGLLGRMAAVQAAASEHAHATLTDLQTWSGLPWHQRLFDTLVVFQNDGADDEIRGLLGESATVRMLPGETQTNFPLALVVSGGDTLVLRLAYHGRFAGVEGATSALAELKNVLLALPSLNGAPVSGLLELVTTRRPAAATTARGPVMPPSTDTEWVVARIWAELLGRDEVGVDENFFDLGGQSLVATQIMSRVRDAFRLELPVSLLFEQPTVQAFSRAVAQRETVGGQVARIARLTRQVEEMTIQELREAGVHA